MSAETFHLSLLRVVVIALAAAASALKPSPAWGLGMSTLGSSGCFPPLLGRRARPGAALVWFFFAHDGASYTLGGCFAQSAGLVKAAQKISSAAGGLNASGVSLGDEYFGASVASLGDFDGDSVNDICAGASRDDDGGINRGSVYVLFLNSNGTVKAAQKISSTQGGLTESGVSLDDQDRFGHSTAAVDDVDGDSVTDICVGVYNDDDGGTNCGAVLMLFLNSDGTVKASQKISSAVGGLSESGVSLVNSDWFGSSVASVGDADGDSVNDICVGASGDESFRGAVYMLFLNSNGRIKASQKISATVGGLSGSGVSLNGNDFFGSSIAATGDLDGNSVTDICVGAIYDDDGGSNRGALYTLFLNANGTVKAAQKISSTQGGLTESGVSLDDQDRFGASTAAVDDVDGDSVIDISVGATYDDDGGIDCGAVYMLFLNSNGTVKASQKISSTQDGLTASGVSLDDGDQFGISVALVGDVDGDSVNDICVGANGDADYAGAVYLLFLDGITAQSGATATSLTMGISASSSSPTIATAPLTLTTAVSSSMGEGSGNGSTIAVTVGVAVAVAAVLLLIVCAVIFYVAHMRQHESDAGSDGQPTSGIVMESMPPPKQENFNQGETTPNYQNLPREGDESPNYQNLQVAGETPNYQNLPVRGDESLNYQNLPVRGDESLNYQNLPRRGDASLNYQTLTLVTDK